MRHAALAVGLVALGGTLGCSDAKTQDVLDDGQALISGSKYPTRNLAFVMVNVGSGVNINAQTAMNRLVNDANSERNLLLYGSYGRQDMTAQVFGPISYPLSSCTNTDMSRLASDLRPQIQSQGSFQHYLWYLGSQTVGCSWSLLAGLGTPEKPAKDSWYNATTSCVALGQGVEQNLGRQHSSTLRCTGAPFADDPNSCTSSEYGDLFDVMGGGCRHSNAWQNASQEWLGGCNGVSVTSSGTFTLLPYERRCDGAQFLKVKAPKQRIYIRPAGGGGGASTENLDYYYVELRTPLDFDGTLGGTALTPRVLIHVAANLRTRSQTGVHTYLLDMTPNTSTFNDAALAQGQTFTDPASGLSITAQAVDANQATIVVQSNGSGAPTCLDGSTFTPPGPDPSSCVDNPPTPVP
jgi:hypothetical protein